MPTCSVSYTKRGVRGRCPNEGSIFRLDAYYCGIHDPVTIKRKRFDRDRFIEARRQLRSAREAAALAVKAASADVLDQVCVWLQNASARPEDIRLRQTVEVYMQAMNVSAELMAAEPVVPPTAAMIRERGAA